jgi:hypothetical protein
LSIFLQGGFFCRVFFVKRFNHKDLLGMGQLSIEDIELIMETAESLKEICQREIRKVPTLRGKSAVHIFYEPSTRTRTSFEMAAKRLSADTVSFSSTGSSMVMDRLNNRPRKTLGFKTPGEVFFQSVTRQIA